MTKTNVQQRQNKLDMAHDDHDGILDDSAERI